MKKLIIISLKITLVTVLVIVPECFLKANNLSINNVELNGQNTTSHFTKIRFDISWENSWRVTSGPSNWDATWVFAKYRLKSQTTWNHATLNWVDGTGSNDGHTVPSGATISSSNDNGSGGAKGVFIYHSSAFSQSSVSYNSVKLRWNYGVDGLSDGDSVEICIFGIEMVYIPQGSFYVGSGGSEYNAIYEYPTTSNPYQITSENAITVGTSSSNLYYAADNGYAGDQSLPINLLSFDAELQNDRIILNWTTTMEINNGYFSVEKSKEALNFQEIGRIKSSGNSSIEGFLSASHVTVMVESVKYTIL